MIRRAAAGLAAALVRILIVYALLIAVSDGTIRLLAQIAPASLWFTFTELRILPSGKVAIAYRESRVGDLPVTVIAELLGEDGAQPCAASGRRLIERDTTYAILPIQRTLPDCDFASLADGAYRLQVTAIYPAIGTVDKSVTIESENQLLVERGRIAGATAIASEAP